MKRAPLYAVGANIFAGGFTLGVARHFKVLAHLEHADMYGAAVSAQNFKGLEIYAPDDGQDPLAAWPKRFDQQVDLLYSNPPCAVWSTLGGAAQRGFDWRDDPRLQRVRDIFALAKRYQPDIWCWESVCGAFTKGREFVDELVVAAAKDGYAATFVFIDARWHGIPQSRKRFFLVLHRVAIDWHPPSYAEPMAAFDLINKVKPKNMGTVLPKRGSALAKLIHASRPGEPLAKAYDRIHGDDPPKNERGQAKGRLARSARRLGVNGVSGAVVSPWLWHPKEDRQLAIEEFAALTGFPPDYKWEERDKVRHDPTVRYMSRGVMPPVAAWLAENFAHAIRAEKKLPGGPKIFRADFRLPPGVVGLDETFTPAVRQTRVRLGGKIVRQSTPRIKRPPVDYDRLTTPPIPKSAPTGTSGEFIRYLLGLARHSDEIIAAMARKAFEGRKTTASDVAWNRGKLKKAGVIAPRVPFLRTAGEAPKTHGKATRRANTRPADKAARSARPRGRRT